MPSSAQLHGSFFNHTCDKCLLLEYYQGIIASERRHLLPQHSTCFWVNWNIHACLIAIFQLLRAYPRNQAWLQTGFRHLLFFCTRFSAIPVLRLVIYSVVSRPYGKLAALVKLSVVDSSWSGSMSTISTESHIEVRWPLLHWRWFFFTYEKKDESTFNHTSDLHMRLW